VPIKTFLVLFVLFLGYIFGLAYIMMNVMRLYIYTAIGLVVFLIAADIFAFSYITYISFATEETDDSFRMADLYNRIKKERNSQLNYIRMDLKLKALDKSRSDAEFNDAFLHTLNSWRMLTLEMYSILATEEAGMKNYKLDSVFDRMQEICFNNPVFMKRLLDQMIDVQ
jgi:hypothetical protein